MFTYPEIVILAVWGGGAATAGVITFLYRRFYPH
jgi:hypothetical protein